MSKYTFIYEETDLINDEFTGDKVIFETHRANINDVVQQLEYFFKGCGFVFDSIVVKGAYSSEQFEECEECIDISKQVYDDLDLMLGGAMPDNGVFVQYPDNINITIDNKEVSER